VLADKATLDLIQSSPLSITGCVNLSATSTLLVRLDNRASLPPSVDGQYRVRVFNGAPCLTGNFGDVHVRFNDPSSLDACESLTEVYFEASSLSVHFSLQDSCRPDELSRVSFSFSALTFSLVLFDRLDSH
jgi:hypothetical protein